MSLSEFISKNQERPDPKIEWAQSKLLIKTVVDSGAVQLMEKLRDSILSNLTLESDGMFKELALSKLLFVHNVREIANNFSKSERNQLERSFHLSVPSKYNDGGSISKLPWVRMIFKYNPERKQYGLGGGYFNAPTSYESYTVFDELVVDCSVPGRLELRGNSSLERVVMEENQWRQQGAVDNELGKLYAKRPSRKIVK